MFIGPVLVIAGIACLITGCGGGSTTNITVVPPGATTFGAKIYRMPSGSMEPTLMIGERITVSPLTSTPRVGDIVVFHPPKEAQQEVCGPTPHVIKVGGAACSEPVPEQSEVNFLKRVVAGPGDEIYVKEGHVFRKAPGSSTFTAEDDSYIKPCPAGAAECNFLTPITIPADHWYMMGDNRGESDDSRFWGPVPTSWIVGAMH